MTPPPYAPAPLVLARRPVVPTTVTRCALGSVSRLTHPLRGEDAHVVKTVAHLGDDRTPPLAQREGGERGARCAVVGKVARQVPAGRVPAAPGTVGAPPTRWSRPRPSSRLIRLRNPKRSAARRVSSLRRGWPSGLVVSQTISPSNPVSVFTVSTSRLMVTSSPAPMLTGSASWYRAVASRMPRAASSTCRNSRLARPGAPHLGGLGPGVAGLDELPDEGRDGRGTTAGRSCRPVRTGSRAAGRCRPCRTARGTPAA